MFEPDSNKLRCNLRHYIQPACGRQGVRVMVVVAVVVEAIAVVQFVVVAELPLWLDGPAPVVSSLPRYSTRPERIFESVTSFFKANPNTNYNTLKNYK